MREGSIKKYLNKKRLIAVVAACLAVVVLVGGIPMVRALAVFDESKAVRFRTYRRTHTIENSVLFIGTHLIHLEGLTDELYEKAVESQADSDQQEVYYKSELADGMWYDITDAVGLSAITTDGTPVQESDLDDLYVTNYTGADGLTKDARTGEVVCIFDDPDPYDLMSLDELEPIRRVYQDKYLATSSDDKSFQYMKGELQKFLTQNLKTDTTNELDQTLKNLQKCYEAYCAAGRDEDAQVIMTLMEGVDAARRADVMQRLLEGMDESSQSVDVLQRFLGTADTEPFTDLNRMSNIVNGEELSSGSENSEDEAASSPDWFRLDTTVVESVTNSISQCTESYTSYAAKMLSPGGSIVRSYIYDQSKKLSDHCSGGSVSIDATMVGLVNNIKYALNIEKGVVADADSELKLIDSEFLPKMSDNYSTQLQKGVSQEYQAAAKANKSDAAKKSILEKDKTDVESARSELESMIAAKKERMSSSDALKYVYERITWTNEQEQKIKKDDFANSAKESTTAHIEWLTQMAQKIVDGDASLMSDMERLRNLLEEYTQKQQEALDDGNLELAAQYGELVDDTSQKIAAEEARLNEILNSDTATAAEKAEASVALGQSGLVNDIKELLQQATSSINSGITGELDNTLDMLGILGAETALMQLKEDVLPGSDLSSAEKEKWTEKIDEAIAKSKESSLHDQANAVTTDNGSGNGSGSGTGSGTGSGNGSGSGSGSGNGSGSGSGSGNGSGSGSGNGSGNGNGSGSGSGNGSGTGSSATNAANLSENTLKAAIRQSLGGSFEELDAAGKVAAAAALDRLYDNCSNVHARDLAKQYIATCVAENSPYVYTQLSGHPETEYISLETIGNRIVTPYRYVYSDFREEATMTHGATSYRFRVGARVVTLSNLTNQAIKRYKVEFQRVPYIDEDTAKTYFDCEAEYIAGSNYSVCLNQKIKEQADALYDTLTGS